MVEKMRIGIDARFLTHPQRGGFKTYTEHLVQALAKVDHDNQYVLYVDRPPLDTDLIPRQGNFRTQVVPGSQPVYGMPWREQYSLVRQMKRDRVDVFHAPCLSAPLFHTVPSVVTIHDMMWCYPTRYAHRNRSSLMAWYYRVVPFFAAKRAKAVITVSNSSKESIMEYLNLAGERIFVTYEAAKRIYRPMADTEFATQTPSDHELHSNYILGIGSADPRKNIRSLIQAYSQIPRNLMENYHLAIVWTHKSLAAESCLEVQKLNISGYVHFLYDVSDEQLVSLYNRASLFVFPSLEEGFGLPPLEAMACGTPVVAANNSSIPEIVDDAALLFPAENVGDLVEAITRVLCDSELRSRMKTQGIERSTSFSWEKCALETIDVYRKATLL